MSAEDKISFHQEFDQVLESGDPALLRDFLDEQNISDLAELLEEFEEYELLIISTLSIHRAASLFKILEDSTQLRIMNNLQPYKMAELLNALSPDDRTDFLEDLPTEVVRDLIKTLDPEERKITL